MKIIFIWSKIKFLFISIVFRFNREIVSFSHQLIFELLSISYPISYEIMNLIQKKSFQTSHSSSRSHNNGSEVWHWFSNSSISSWNIKLKRLLHILESRWDDQEILSDQLSVKYDFRRSLFDIYYCDLYHVLFHTHVLILTIVIECRYSWKCIRYHHVIVEKSFLDNFFFLNPFTYWIEWLLG